MPNGRQPEKTKLSKTCRNFPRNLLLSNMSRYEPQEMLENLPGVPKGAYTVNPSCKQQAIEKKVEK